MKILFFVSVLLLFQSCVHDKPADKSKAVDICFKLITENKLQEFKEKKEQCKVYRNPLGLTSLMMAIAKDKNDFAEFLMDEMVDVNATDNAGTSALTFAANKNNARLVQLLRRHGARIEIVNNNLSGLMMAVRNSSLNLIQVMNPTPEEINLKAEDGWTALYFAISRSDADILQFLLDQGACTKTKDTYGQKPFDFAKEIKWKKGQQILFRKKTSC